MASSTAVRVAILQSSYIPWKGFFDILDAVDTFIWLDDVQYTRRDWRSRNRIKTASGPRWLTIPVLSKDHHNLRILDARVVEGAGWAASHWGSIAQAYGGAPFFGSHGGRLREAYEAVADAERLVDVDRHLVSELADMLGITTPTVASTELLPMEELARLDPTARLVALVHAVGGTEYLSGPSARDYIDTAAFDAAGVALRYADYAGYPEYPQLHGPFEHAVSVVDLVLNTGDAARTFMKGTGVVSS